MEIAETALCVFPPPVYCLREIVHNRQVVEDLAAKGVVFVQDVGAVPEGATLLFSAHGVSPAVRAQTAKRHLNVVDATCPFVSKVHNEVRRYADQGYSILLVGHKTHDEIVGVAGEAPDRVSIVASHADAENVAVPDAARVAVVTQTTLSVEETSRTLDTLRKRFPAMRTPDRSDICYATTNRQKAVAAVAAEADIMLVLGSENSSNSKRLVEVAQSGGCRAELVATREQLRNLDLASCAVVGIAAGASTPESFVDDAVAFLKTAGFSRAMERVVEHESLMFPLPESLRRRLDTKKG
jgi:4-hydroxy-3-methylbut-2-enyl diphosphate reductase